MLCVFELQFEIVSSGEVGEHDIQNIILTMFCLMSRRLVLSNNHKWHIYKKTLDFKYILWQLIQNPWKLRVYQWKLTLFVKIRTFLEHLNWRVSYWMFRRAVNQMSLPLVHKNIWNMINECKFRMWFDW